MLLRIYLCLPESVFLEEVAKNCFQIINVAA